MQADKPAIKMVTEAGLIGKIGFNDAGVGVCLNALKARGMDARRLPCHLALRMVLESRSRKEAVDRLTRYGVASACHMLIADAETGGVGMEFSALGHRQLDMNGKGQVVHSNHYLMPQEGVEDSVWLKDSPYRVDRMATLVDQLQHADEESIRGLFVDEENYPASICRKQDGESQSETLFNIVMDLKRRRARVLLGRPIEPEEDFEMIFDHKLST